MPDVFLSFATPDLAPAEHACAELRLQGIGDVFLDRDARTGVQPGEEWERSLLRQIRATRAMVVLWSEAYDASRWCFLEHTLARSLGKPLLVVRLDDHPIPAVVSHVQVANAQGAGFDAALGQVLRRLQALGIPRRQAFSFDPLTTEPYPGMAAYAVDQAAVFFGRDREVQEILSRIRAMLRRSDKRWLILVGASGSGKSSLLRAGIIAHLRLEPGAWEVLGPYEAPEHALAPVPRSGEDGHPKTVVVLDQLEQWLVPEREGVCVQQVQRLESAREAGAFVLAAVRSDHLDLLQRHAAFREMPLATVPIGPFSQSALREVIAGPARLAGVEMEDTLTDELLSKSSGETLPVLAFVLHELWLARTSDSLDLAAFRRELGSVSEAISRRATGAARDLDLDPASDEELATVLVRLVRFNAPDHPTKRRIPQSDVPERLAPFFKELDRLRLLRGDTDEQGVPMWEVMHEAIFEAWDPFRKAIDEARAFLGWHRRFVPLVDAAGPEPWPAGALLAGHLLDEAKRFRSTHGKLLNERETRYVDASAQEAERIVHEAETRRLEAEAARLDAEAQEHFSTARLERTREGAAVRRANALAAEVGALKVEGAEAADASRARRVVLEDELAQARRDSAALAQAASSHLHAGRYLVEQASKVWSTARLRGGTVGERPRTPSVFSIELLGSDSGESILVHYGPPEAPCRVLIDGGGQRLAWKKVLRPRLAELRERHQPRGALDLEAVIASHWDMDRLGGLIELVKEQSAHGPDTLPVSIRRIFFNVPRPWQDYPKWALAIYAETAGVPLNPGFRGMVFRGQTVPQVDLGHGLTMTVLGPTVADLYPFLKVVDKEAKQRGGEPCDLTEIVEALRDAPAPVGGSRYTRSIPNRASFILLFELGGRRFLYSGDSDTEQILEGLAAATDRSADGAFPVDVLHIPHYGGRDSVTESFLRLVPARHYVVTSMVRNFALPRSDTIQMLIDAVGRKGLAIHFAHRDGASGPVGQSLDKVFAVAIEQGMAVKRVFPTGGASSVVVDLDEPLSP